MKATVAESVATWRTGRFTAATASAIESSASRTGANKVRPCSVNITWRVWRTNKGAPRPASSSRIRWLIAVGVTASSAAARLKLPKRAAASKARKAPSGGRRRISRLRLFHRIL